LLYLLMSQNLSPIRKFAYKYDRRQHGMIGTVTQRDTRLEWCENLKGSPLREGKTARGGSQSLEGGAFLSCQRHDRSASDARASRAGSSLPKICHISVTPILETVAGACAGWI
jgi:hypothetical protein